MKRTMIGVVAAAVLFTCAVAWAGSATAPARATWGQVLLICDEHDAHSARDVAEVYDPASNQFAAKRPVMKMGRTGTTATVITTGPNAGRVLVAGGFNHTIGPLSSSEIYDPATNRFIRGPVLSDDFVDPTATVIESVPKIGWILTAALRTTNLYDPGSNRFAAGPKMSNLRMDHTATAITSGPNAGKILFAGGMERSDTATDLYDPATNSFEPGPRMNTGRDRHTATLIRTGRNAGKILLVGGYTERWVKDDVAVDLPVASTELYDPASKSFARPDSTATLKVARAFHTATIILSGPNAGKILIVGGEQDGRVTLSSTELYDPSTNSFSAGPPLYAARTQHVAITIASGPNAGKILIAGGNFANENNRTVCFNSNDCSFTDLASTELYNPATNSFEIGPAMRGAPGDVVAVQLPPAPPR